MHALHPVLPVLSLLQFKVVTKSITKPYMNWTDNIELKSNFLYIMEIYAFFSKARSKNNLTWISYFCCSAISDTCMAMGEWVENPHRQSALSDVLPCVDPRTTNKTLFQSKQVVINIANVVNQFIYNNANTATQGTPGYYNQSGPSMPSLCYPFDSQLQERQCTTQEVSSANASMVFFHHLTWLLSFVTCWLLVAFFFPSSPPTPPTQQTWVLFVTEKC